MSQWKNTDDAANSVLWAVAQFKKPANSDNQAALFGNTTANAFIDGVTIGQYGVSASEMRAARVSGLAKPAHAGWVLKVDGSGGRANRTQYETLVAMKGITGDAEDTAFPDLTIVISTQPESATGNSSNDDIVDFTVVAVTVPAGSALTYQWKYANGTNLSDAGAYSNTTTATLSVLANTASSGETYKVAVSNSQATTVTSVNVVFTDSEA